jgi:hypothetical protein
MAAAKNRGRTAFWGNKTLIIKKDKITLLAVSDNLN